MTMPSPTKTFKPFVAFNVIGGIIYCSPLTRAFLMYSEIDPTWSDIIGRFVLLRTLEAELPPCRCLVAENTVYNTNRENARNHRALALTENSDRHHFPKTGHLNFSGSLFGGFLASIQDFYNLITHVRYHKIDAFNSNYVEIQEAIRAKVQDRLKIINQCVSFKVGILSPGSPDP